MELNPLEQAEYIKASNAAILHLQELEPKLLHPVKDDDILTLKIQPDSAGISGDVRDILTLRLKYGWEVGISAKKNHTAVKHSRLSNSIDFGKKWLGVNSGDDYFNAIMPIFDELAQLRAEGELWHNIPNKIERFYKPVLESFKAEILRIDKLKPSHTAPTLLKYLIGTKDFYKIIKGSKKTEIQAYNINGTLNQSSGKIKPSIKVPKLKLPNRIIEIAYKPQSTNTLIITFDEGWQISFRIHNASSIVEASLKFDVQLHGRPTSLYTHIELWQE
jgi:hypothetical protein